MESAVIPYWPCTGWYRVWLSSLLSGSDEHAAVLAACSHYPVVDNRSLTRTRFESGGDVFSVPVTGGASSLKRLPAGRLIVSGHDNWSQRHFRTLGTIYGRSPFFPHFSSRLQEIYDAATGRPFAELSQAIHKLISSTLLPPGVTESFLKAVSDTGKATVIRQRCKSFSDVCDDDTPICALLFEYGPEAIFPLVDTFLKQ